MTRPPRAVIVLALAFLAAHLPFFPQSLGDVDSINFALGLRDFDVTRHQPHPPGYPVYMAAVHAVSLVAGSELRTLALTSMVCGALGVVALYALFGIVAPRRNPPESRGTGAGSAIAATLLAATAPLYWFTAARPLSDVPGLAAAVGLQALILNTVGSRELGTAALVAGVGAGVRSQVVWLTVPLLVLQWMRNRDGERWRTAALIAAAYFAGVLVWAVPLVMLNGGPGEYWRALFNQGAEDLSGVTMLWTDPSPRQLVLALRNAFLLPWALVPVGMVVVASALAGALSLLRWPAGRTVVLTLAAAYGPYFAFDLLFQETVTTRYALPLIVPMALLAVEGARLLFSRAPIVLAGGLAAVNIAVVMPSVNAYAREATPAFRMLGEMRAAGGAASPTEGPVLGMHRRAAFDLRRPFEWLGSGAPAFTDRLASPPKHEWLELVNYWRGGGRQAVWFVADPLRSDLALIDKGTPVRYRWPFDPGALLGGIRPNQMDWHRLEAPGWYLGEGWALTPETAGVAREDAAGPGLAPIEGWLRRHATQVNMLIGGRNLSGPSARLQVSLDGSIVDEATIAPGFFLRSLTLPAGRLAGSGDYATIAVSADSDQMAIEQFDAQPAGRVIFGFDEGWYEHEYNPSTGLLWRWASERAVIRVRGAGHDLVLRLAGEIEAASRSQVTVKVGDRVLAQQEVGRSFRFAVPIPSDELASDEQRVTIESTAWYVPAEQRFRRSADPRRLALKVYECVVVPAAAFTPPS